MAEDLKCHRQTNETIHIMQQVFDFLAGNISPEDFKIIWYSNEKLRNWINDLIDLKSPLDPAWNNYPYQGHRAAIHNHYNGSVEEFIRKSDAAKQKKKSVFGTGWALNAIAAVVVIAYPDVKITHKYEDEIKFYLALCGEIYGGEEVEQVINDIILEHPESLGRSKRIKMAKQRIREVFHVDKKYPRWIQEPDWPMGEKSPMKFVSQSHEGDLYKYEFVDVDSGKSRVLTQLA
ncbi:MAG: hypothetical protein IJS71_06405 [Clostridia bacterium]|nr:hypothetical protein [Clostridia bacterium]